MCTAVSYTVGDHYFGRNLDLERSYGEQVVVVPREYEFRFRRAGALKRHYAMIGMAAVAEGVPLFFDAVNEKGLGMAGLNFPGFAQYMPETAGRDNIAPFELIPWILAQCADVSEAQMALEKISIAKIDFSDALPLTPLHWMVADRNGSIAVESMQSGLNVHDNPACVLTNSPPFDMQLFNLNNYMKMSTEGPENTFSGELDLHSYSLGMGAMGLPGDLSSMSRFVRAAFAVKNSRAGESEAERVSQFFHILGFVAQVHGLVCAEGGMYEFTRYSSCCNASRGVYYYTTYDNSRVAGVDMHRENLDGDRLSLYPLVKKAKFDMRN